MLKKIIFSPRNHTHTHTRACVGAHACMRTHMHTHTQSLLLSRFRSRNRWTVTCAGLANCYLIGDTDVLLLLYIPFFFWIFFCCFFLEVSLASLVVLGICLTLSFPCVTSTDRDTNTRTHRQECTHTHTRMTKCAANIKGMDWRVRCPVLQHILRKWSHGAALVSAALSEEEGECSTHDNQRLSHHRPMKEGSLYTFGHRLLTGYRAYKLPLPFLTRQGWAGKQ